MASYFVWLSLGLYPSTATEIYLISTPTFYEARIELGNGQGTVHLIADNLDRNNKYVVSATLNGKRHDRAWLYHWEIKNGAEIRFEMGSKPSEFGLHDLPPSDTIEC